MKAIFLFSLQAKGLPDLNCRVQVESLSVIDRPLTNKPHPTAMADLRTWLEIIQQLLQTIW